MSLLYPLRWVAILGLLAGCAGKQDYQPPQASESVANTKTVSMSKDQLWPRMVASLSKHFFVINNIDKSSGLINVSYSGDPEKYVDCGQLRSYVKNARGERTYDFPAARQHEVYEVMTNGRLVYADRTMSLEGRVNLIIEELPNKQTLITANTKYILQKDVRLSDPMGHQANVNDTISFNTGGSAEFSNQGLRATCRATGELEAELLSMIS